MRKTKIVCTIGPSCSSREIIVKMARAGMNVVRINTSHTDVERLSALVMEIRSAEREVGNHISIMLDLQGPRIRVGPIQGSSVELKKGQKFILTTLKKRGNNEMVSVPHGDLPKELKAGDRVLINDGLLKLKVLESRDVDVVCEVENDGILMQGKGMNFPGTRLGLPAVTERDINFLKGGLKAGVDWISQSFVSSSSDVLELKHRIEEIGYKTPVMAKIEKGEAVKEAREIMSVADGVMIARGDLGVEMKMEDVPIVQKELISMAVEAARPVVTATQMLESMVKEPMPTRAEASDIANAILDGTDAAMLSAETAIGMYPVEAVEVMAKIASRTEQTLGYEQILKRRGEWSHLGTTDAICYAACKVASDLGARGILCVTRTGYTAMHLSRFRPREPVIAASMDESVLRKLCLSWGVHGIHCEFESDFKLTIVRAISVAIMKGLLKSGDLVVVVSGFLGEKSGTTNMIYVHRVE
ncbi:MAG: pyruvate kinase [Actinomycetota bacterium]|nr:pyruvate kinase [Actinomycetota bacterium]